MSDLPDNDTSGSAAKPESRPSRSFDASRRLSQLLARPLGTPPAPGETPVEPRELPAAPAPAAPSAHEEANAPVRPPPVAAPPPESEPAVKDEDAAKPQPPSEEREALPEPIESVAAEPPVEIPAPPAAAAERAAPLSAAPSEAPPVAPTPRGPAPPPAAETPADGSAERHLGKIRRLMLVANLFMFIAVAAVLGVIGFRVFHSGDTAPAKAPAPPAAEAPLETMLSLPRGARVVQTAVADDRLVITIEVDGKWEVRTFDVTTLKPAGRMTFTTVP